MAQLSPSDRVIISNQTELTLRCHVALSNIPEATSKSDSIKRLLRDLRYWCLLNNVDFYDVLIQANAQFSTETQDGP